MHNLPRVCHHVWPANIQGRKEREDFGELCPFLTKEVGHPVLTATNLAFSVNKPITIHGLTLYGGSEQSYTYKVTVLGQGKVLTSSEGRFSQGDYFGDGYVNVNLKNTVKLEVSAN